MIDSKPQPLWQSGFTLTEMAMVLVIISLLIGSLVIPLSAQQDARNRGETEKSLAEIREALVGYALIHGYLPCPAVSSSDGSEDRNGGTGVCNKRFGFLPWTALSTAKSDSWGRLYGYSVTSNFANSSAKFALTTARDITVLSRDSTGAISQLSNVDDVPAVVFSYGKNGYNGTDGESGTTLADSTAATNNQDEDVNAGTAVAAGYTVNRAFFSHTPTSDQSAAGEFDDIVVWLSAQVLFSRMVAAGAL